MNRLRLQPILTLLKHEPIRVFQSPLLLISALTGFISFVGIARIQELIAAPILEALAANGVNGDLPAALLKWTLATDPFLESNPLLACYSFLVQASLPWIALTFGVNQTTEDLSLGHSRILLSRITRMEFYLGRFLCALALWFFLGGCGIGLGAWMIMDGAEGTYLAAATMTFRGLVYGAPFIAYSACLNTFFRKPMLVLIGGMGLWLVMAMIGAGMEATHPIATLCTHFLPTWIGPSLFIPTEPFSADIPILLGYTAAFLVIGGIRLSWRELR